jgi:light-regulated signal transduction histidine kinase (bacteriophytochrome)
MSAHEHFVRGLVSNPLDLLAVADATGAAVQIGDELHRVGDAPGEEATWSIVRWLSDRGVGDGFASDHLSAEFPEADAFADVASGLLAISIPRLYRGYILWFRPEVVRTITWAGDPNKAAAAPEPGGRINPRNSFAAWKEQVHRRSIPWSQIEIDTAVELREAIVRIVLHKAEELEQLSASLAKTNKELEAFSYSVSHDLRAPFRHIVGFSQLLRERLKGELDETSRRYLETIAGAAQHAGSLVDGLLAFSQMGRTALDDEPLNLRELFEIARNDVVASEGAGRPIEWRVADLPPVRGDRTLLTLVARNLLSNAVKYTRRRERAVVEIGCVEEPGRYIFFVKDNGVGFDMAYAGKLFGVFQRLHLQEDFEGTGIGLANVRRIIERHGGQTWAEGKPDEGAAFFFTLPKPQEG